MSNYLFRSENVSIEDVKLLIPKIMLGCWDYFPDYKSRPEGYFTYDRIKDFFSLDGTDLDDSHVHYQVQPRLEKYPLSGRLAFAYDNNIFDVSIINQSCVAMDAGNIIDEVFKIVKEILDKENIDCKYGTVVCGDDITWLD